MTPAPDQIAAVVLAGGFGTRIRHLLRDLPKPMAPVCGRPFVEWVVRHLARQGVRQVVLSTGHLAETVAGHFQSQPVPGVTVQCVPESQPLGTAGGFLNALAAVQTAPAAWLVLNGDSLALAPLAGLFHTLADPTLDGAILGLSLPEAARYGTVTANAAGLLTGFREKQPGAGIINAGIYLFRTPLVGTFPARRPLSFESDVFPALAARQARIRVCVTDAPFLDIGTPESLPLAEAFIREHADGFPVDSNGGRAVPGAS